MRHAYRRPKYSAARAFYLTILVISAIAAFSLITSRKHPDILAEANRQLFRRTEFSVEEHVHGTAGKLVQRDEAVRRLLLERLQLSERKADSISVVPTRPQRQKPMRLCPRQLPRRRGRSFLLPTILLLQATQGPAGSLCYSGNMAWPPIQHHWHCGQRLLLHKP